MPKQPTFNEAMNQWSSKRSRIGNPILRLFHPDPSASAGLRVLGYVIRLLLFLCVGGLVFAYLAIKNLNDNSFKNKLVSGFADMTGATSHEMRFASWKNTTGFVRQFRAEGGDHSFYRALQLWETKFELDPTSLYSESWELKNFVIDRVIAELRSGGADSVERKSEFPSSIQVNGGLGISPNLLKTRVSPIEINSLSLNWGVSLATHGELQDARAVLSYQSMSQWKIAIRDGTLSQNWLKSAELKQLKVERQPGKLLFRDGELVFRGKMAEQEGSGSLEGEVTTEVNPRLGLELVFQSVPVSAFLSSNVDQFFSPDTRISGSNLITGSTNLKSGVVHGIKATVDGGSLQNVPILSALAYLTKINYFPITSGKIAITTEGRNISVESLVLESAGVGRIVIEGKIAIPIIKTDPLSTKRRMKAVPDQIEILEATTTELEFNGTMKIGFLSPITPNQMTEKYFEQSDGYNWIDVPLNGKAETLTQEFANQIREEYSAMIDR